MKYIDKDKLKEWFDLEKDFILLDCREYSDYVEEHIKGAISFDYVKVSDEEFLRRGIGKDKKIVTSCHAITCDASTNCYARLKKMGYKNLHEYTGGLTEWKTFGFPTIKTAKNE